MNVRTTSRFGCSVLALALVWICSQNVVAATDPGIVGVWLFEEGSGDIALDSSGNGHDGTVINGPNEWVAGKYGTAMEFNNVNSRVDVPDTDDLDLDTFTVEVWAKCELKADFQGLVSKTDDAGRNYGIFVIVQGFTTGVEGGIHASVPGAATFGSTAITDNTWHHVAMTSDGSMLRVYVDGEVDVETPIADGTTMYHGPDPLRFGADIPTRHPSMNGALDEIGIWNVARTADEIRGDMDGLARLVTAVDPQGKLETMWATVKTRR